MTYTPIATHLKNHPRLMGVLFATVLLLSQAGSAAATGCVYLYGP